MKPKILFIFLSLLIGIVLICACASQSNTPSDTVGTNLSMTPPPTEPTSAYTPIPTDTEPVTALSATPNPQNTPRIASIAQKVEFDFSSVAMAHVITIHKNWDADAEDDGVAIFPSLLDTNEKTVEFYGVTLPVDIEIWTKKWIFTEVTFTPGPTPSICKDEYCLAHPPVTLATLSPILTNPREIKDQLIYSGKASISSWEDGNRFLRPGIRVPFEDIKVPADKEFGWTFVKIYTPDGKVYEAVDELTKLKL